MVEKHSVKTTNMELNDLRKNICLRKSDVSAYIERISLKNWWISGAWHTVSAMLLYQ